MINDRLGRTYQPIPRERNRQHISYLFLMGKETGIEAAYFLIDGGTDKQAGP